MVAVAPRTPERGENEFPTMVRLALIAAVLVLAIALAWWFFPPDPVRVLRAHASLLESVTRAPAPELGAGIERWTLHTRAGWTAQGLWRAAPPGVLRPWTAVLLGGIGTGEDAARLIPKNVPVNVLAMAWPWNGPLRLDAWQVARRLGAMQQATLRSPAVLALGLEAAARQPDVDPDRIVLVGASLGVPPAVAALRLTHVPEALVLVDGAAHLAPVLDATLRRDGVPRPWSTILAAIAYRLGRPLEPALHGDAADSVRILIMSARDDELIPRPSIRALQETFPGAEVHWFAGIHMQPDRADLIDERIREAVEWLDQAPGAARTRER